MVHVGACQTSMSNNHTDKQISAYIWEKYSYICAPVYILVHGTLYWYMYMLHIFSKSTSLNMYLQGSTIHTSSH